MIGLRCLRDAVTLTVVALLSSCSSLSTSDREFDREVDAALNALYDSAPTAKTLGAEAKGILVFPDVHKAGLMVGGQRGNGALIKNGQKVAYYRSTAVSVGLQAGAQKFGYALFFMTDAAMDQFEKSKNFELGVGPSVVFVDKGAARDINTLTARADVYGFTFGQKGLMAGMGLQGTKITRLSEASGVGSTGTGSSARSSSGR